MRQGFSLIELLVVVAIIAILGAMAMPLYFNYNSKIKVSSIMGFFENCRNLQMKYYSQNGVFANAQTLGLGNGVVVSNPNTYSPYVTNVFVKNYGASCPNPVAEISAMFNSSAIGFSGGQNTIYYELLISAHSNDVFHTYCFYRTDNGMTAAQAAQYLPSNCQSPAPSNGCV